jgi:hypothetical protein
MKRLRPRARRTPRTTTFVNCVPILSGIAAVVASFVLRQAALPELAHRLKLILLTAVFAASFFVLGASGQIASGAAANEPAEPLTPYARTGFAYSIDSIEAVLVGFVNARGSETTARFQVGRTKSYGRWFPQGPPEHFYFGYHPSEVETGVGRLRARTTYHFRLVATNAGGTTYGKDKTFRTRPR